MLDYVHKLTRTPWAMRESDVQKLREAGFEDLAILHVAQLAAFFNYLNRVADGLGVELDEGVWNHLCQHAPIPWEMDSGSHRPEPAAVAAAEASRR